jgi:hypothetical protein
MVEIQPVQSITQFYFNLPNHIEITGGTTFQAAYYDDDGEGTYFIWNFTNLKDKPYDFIIHSDMILDEEKLNQTQSVEPQSEIIHNIYEYKFAIDENITHGRNIELCVQNDIFDACEWPQPVDEFGRVLGDLSGTMAKGKR